MKLVHWQEPDVAAMARLVESQRACGFSYEEAGGTRGECPRGYAGQKMRAELGRGEAAFRGAAAALRAWRVFDVPGMKIWPRRAKFEAGATLAVAAKVAGFWVLDAVRVAYVVEEHGAVERFGFAYGTMPAHVLHGEKLFLVEWERATDVVTCTMRVFSRPAHWLTWVGYPVVRWKQRVIGRASVERLREAAESSVASLQSSGEGAPRGRVAVRERVPPKSA